jgi:hypothetical protein
MIFRDFYFTCVALVMLGVSGRCDATEFDQTHADLGYFDTLAGVVPPPGVYVRDDVTVQTSGTITDASGHSVSINLGPYGKAKVKFRETTVADILSVAYVPDWKIPYIDGTIGMAAYGFVANLRLDVSTAFGVPQSHATEKAGFGDLTVLPFFLAFHIPGTALQVALSPLEFTAPTGRYAKDDPIGNNVGLNYWSYRPSLALTYLTQTGQDFSISGGLSVNTQNQATHYRSGTEAYVTWAAEQFLPGGFSLGLGGYYYKQIGNDRLNGQVVDQTPATDPLGNGPGNLGEVFAIGPLASYRIRKDLSVEIHWDHEVLAYDRPKRDLIYARAVLRF